MASELTKWPRVSDFGIITIPDHLLFIFKEDDEDPKGLSDAIVAIQHLLKVIKESQGEATPIITPMNIITSYPH